jgi:zona occludens toxin (predicted ATPase)
VLTRCKESADLVDDCVSGSRRRRWSDVKEAEEISEAMLAESVDDKHLTPAVLPVHVGAREVNDAHVDVH